MQTLRNVRTGSDAVDRNGDKVGTVEDVGTGYFVITKGLIFQKDIFVPMSAVDSVDPEGYVRLNVDKDQIDSMGWDDVPTEAGVHTTGDGDYVSNDASYGTTDAGYVNSDASHRTTERTDAIGRDSRTTDGDEANDTLRVPVREEQLRAEKVREQAGEVRIAKNVVEEERTIDVPVTHEEVEVRRYAVDRPASEAEIVDTSDTIRVPVLGERVDVQKDVRVVEELEVVKRAITENQRVSDTVRREQVDVDQNGDTAITGDAGTRRAKGDRS